VKENIVKTIIVRQERKAEAVSVYFFSTDRN